MPKHPLFPLWLKVAGTFITMVVGTTAFIWAGISYIDSRTANIVERPEYSVHVDHEHQIHDELGTQIEQFRIEQREDFRELITVIRELDR